jgi:hypothetical protein
MALTVSSTNQALLDAQLELWHTTFTHIKSMALKSALDLRIADAIDHHGGAATLPQILTRITLHPSKIPCLRRLLRVLTTTGVFGAHHPAADDGCDGREQVYALTPVSRLLVGPSNMNPLTTLLLDTTFVSPFLGLGAWLQLPVPMSLFEMKHGQAIWDFADQNQAFGDMFNEACVSDSSFIMNIVTEECVGIFEGVTSLVDVAGGLGGAAQAIAKAFPHITCSVLDLPHVIANAPASTDVKYIAGDMFESVPPANSVFLKVSL